MREFACHVFKICRLLPLVVLLAACGERAAFQISGITQGTTYHITVVADKSAAEQAALKQQIENRLNAIDSALSNYRDDSELSRFNRAAVGEWFALGTDLYHVLYSSQAISAACAGVFDVTIAPLVDLWGFGARGHRADIPGADAIAAAKADVDYRFLELDKTAPRARKNHPLRIDVNGIAQGYTVDRLAELLAAQGYKDFLVEVGGELRLAGANARLLPWHIGIEKPADGLGAVQQAISGTNIGVTTAGDYHDYFEKDGQRYSHTIDPTTGRPIAHRLASVTVIGASAEYADGWDTALEVMGPERGYAFAEQHHIAAYFIIRADNGFTVRYTPEFARYLR
ncbi:MAG TPA: FAD:protein FMN transferase [Spongiibacteraceae bacterium]|nr:FAD:protein FMN transferase [Spongiibacteraceae bacterium]